MKRYLLKIVSALLTGVMLVGTAVPAMADISDIQVIDLSDADNVGEYINSSDKGVTINIIENGEKSEDTVDTEKLVANNMATLKAPNERNGLVFLYYEYVTTARNYVASYDNEFTFYVDPPMTINVVYGASALDNANSLVAGMYKDPEVKKDGNTYFYCSVAAKSGISPNSTTAEIIFGRSQIKNADEPDGINSEKVTTSAEQNIYDESSKNTFQYIVSSGIKVGGPINFEADVSDSTENARIKTWDFSSGAFYNAKADDVINGLSITRDDYVFDVSAGDKIRVYATSAPTVKGAAEIARDESKHIYEYKANETSITVSKADVTKIMVNPMDVVIVENEGQDVPELPATTGTIKVTVKSNSTVNSGTPLSGATVTATMESNSVTIPETGKGVYSVSAPAGEYSINVELNGQTANDNVTVKNGETTAVDISIKDIEAERQEKIKALLYDMLEEDGVGGDLKGSKWNKEEPDNPKWSYINGCMTTAFMDIYEVTDDENLKKNCFETTDNFQNTSIAEDYKVLGVDSRGNEKNRNLADSQTLDDINPAKSILDIIEFSNKDDRYNSAHTEKFTTFVKTKITPILSSVTRINNGNFYHKDTYPHQVWLDGTYMALPYMLQYIRLYPNETIAGKKGKEEVINDVVSQFKNIEAKMKDPNTGLYYHGYDAQADTNGDNDPSKAMSWANGSTAKETWKDDNQKKPLYVVNVDGDYSSFESNANMPGCSANFWSRSIGWFAMALIDSYEQILLMEKADNTTYEQKNDIARIFVNLMDSVCDYQYELDEKGDPTGTKGNGTGLWYQVTDHPEGQNHSDLNYIESSGSATFAAALMKGYNLKIYDAASSKKHTSEEFYNAGLNAFNALTDYKLNETGALKDICKSAGLAGNDGSSAKNHKTGVANLQKGEKSILTTNDWHKWRDGSLDYYLSEPVVENDAKGAAPYLMAYAQKLQHDKVAAGN